MYLDPGFGGMLLQVLVAIVAAGGAIVFSFRRRIKTWFNKGPKPRVIREIDDSNDNDMVDALETELEW